MSNAFMKKTLKKIPFTVLQTRLNATEEEVEKLKQSGDNGKLIKLTNVQYCTPKNNSK